MISEDRPTIPGGPEPPFPAGPGGPGGRTGIKNIVVAVFRTKGRIRRVGGFELCALSPFGLKCQWLPSVYVPSLLFSWSRRTMSCRRLLDSLIYIFIEAQRAPK